MSDKKSSLPDFKEISSITGKLFKDIKTSVGQIIQDYKSKREQPGDVEVKATKTVVESELVKPEDVKPTVKKNDDVK